MNDLVLLAVGAGIAIIGGYIGDEVRAWRERSRERDSIKICIADELREIESTIASMHQVWENAQLFHPNYVSDLLSNTSAYDELRARLFLIKSSTIRKEIGAFYKKLKDTAHKTEGKIGTLAETPEAIAEQRAFDTTFQTIATEAKTLREKLEK